MDALISYIRKNIDKKMLYQSQRFYLYEDIGNSFLVATLDFFLSNLIFLIFIFMVGKIILKIFSKYFFSSFFITYQFNFYFFLMIL